MKTNRSSGRLIGVGILSAIVASLCCITPVLALIAGTAGIASTFSWLDPVRPYLVGITLVVLVFAWYQKLKSGEANNSECTCEGETDSRTGKKISFWKSKFFFGIITLFVIGIITFPNYSKVFYPKETTSEMAVRPDHIRHVHLQIYGMTCAACGQEVKHAVAQLPGFIDASVNYKTGNAIVKYNPSKTSAQQVDSAVNTTGYRVTDQKASL